MLLLSYFVMVDALTQTLIRFGKAIIAWSDTTCEKCWQSWLLFMKNQKIERNELILMREQLAGKIASSSLCAHIISLTYFRSYLEPLQMISINVDC